MILHYTATLLAVVFLWIPTTYAQRPPPAKSPLRLIPLMFTSKKGSLFSAELGQLKVRENRAVASSRQIRLPVLKLKSRIEKPTPPIIYLADGPGGMATVEGFLLESIFQPLLRNHDIILVDQRGTGRAKPLVFWEAPESLPLEYFTSYDRMISHDREMATQAVDMFRKQNIDLNGYNTVASSDDLKDLAAALGTRRVILVGYGYGAHLALATIRRHPGLVQSAVLIAPKGPDHLLTLPSTIEKHLKELSDLAEQDQANRLKVSDMTSLAKIILRRLDRVPITVSVRDRRTREMVSLELGRFGLQLVLARSMARKEHFTELPTMLHLAAKQDYSILRKHVERIYNEQGRGFSGMSSTMSLYSGATADRLAAIAREADTTILGNAMNYPPFDTPDIWGNPDLGNSFRSPVVSNHSVLFVSGTLDPTALPEQTEEIRVNFSKGVHCVVENADHAELVSHGRVQRVILDFLTNKRVGDMRIPIDPPIFLPIP